MRCQEINEDLEAFVLGALEPRRERRIDAHIERCEECARLVRDYRLAAEQMALDVPLYRAPARLKDRIMAAIGAAPTLRPRSLLRMRLLGGAVAAVLVTLAIGGVTWAVILSAEMSQLREDNRHLTELTTELSELDNEQRITLLRSLSIARNEQQRVATTLEEQATTLEQQEAALEEQEALLVLALDPDLIPTELQGTQFAPDASCSYVWSTKQEVGALTCKNMPTTSFLLAYELWVVRGDTLVAVGAFVPRADGTAQLLVKFPEDSEGPVSNVWITLEQVSASSGMDDEPSDEVILIQAPVKQAAR